MSFKSTVSLFSNKKRSFESIIDSDDNKNDDVDETQGNTQISDQSSSCKPTNEQQQNSDVSLNSLTKTDENILNVPTMDDDEEEQGEEDNDNTKERNNKESVNQEAKNKLAKKYLEILENNDKKCDKKFGVRNLVKGLMIRDKNIQFGVNDVEIDGVLHHITKGLLELNFIKSPDKNVLTQNDYSLYK